MDLTKGGKIAIAVAATAVAGAIAFPCVWTGVNWKKVHEYDSAKQYTITDLKKAADDAVKEMLADNLNKQKTIDALQNELVEANFKLAEANSKVTAAQEQTSKDKQQIESLSNQINLLDETVANLTGVKNQIEQELAIKQARIVELEEQLANSEEGQEEIVTELAQARARVAELEETNTEQAVLLNNLNTQKFALQTEYNNLVALTSDSVNTINALNIQIAGLQADINYYAELLSAYQNENQIIATFLFKDNTYKILIVNKGECASVADPVTEENEDFLGWVKQGTYETIDITTTPLNEDTVFIAKLAEAYKVTFVSENEFLTSKKVTPNTTVQVDNPASTSKKIFKGWALTANATIDEIIDINTILITSPRTFYAVWEYYFEVKFSIDGALDDTREQLVKKGEFAIVDNPVKDGYIFDGWSTDGKVIIDNIAEVEITADVIFIAMFSEAVGLFEEVTNTLIMSWEEMINDGYFYYSNGYLGMSSNHSNLKTVLNGNLYLPSGMKTISSSVFEGCVGLTKVFIPDGVEEISEGAFTGCSNLIEVIIPDSIKSISRYSFSNCNKLKFNYKNACYLGNSKNPYLVLLNVEAGITDLEIHPQTKIIAKQAVYYIKTLKNVAIPEGIISIGYRAFGDCVNLTKVIIPSSVLNIEQEAFSYCDALDIYCMAESQPSNWHANWNSSNRPVTWGYEIE